MFKEFTMKNVLKVLGTIVLIVMIGFSFIACDDESTDGKVPQTVTYESSTDAAGNTYTLTITENTSRAAYTAATGDSYVLTIKKAGTTDKVSKGTVSTVGADGTLTLKPNNSGSSTFSITISNGQITAINGTIAIEDGEPVTAPGTLTPETGGGSDISMTWTIVADSKFGTSNITAIVYGNDKFVAGSVDGKMAYSSDGINWTAVTNTTLDTSSINAIAYGNDKFVAVNSSGNAAYSSNGVTWTAVRGKLFGENDLINPAILTITYGNGTFLAGGIGNRKADSSDGVTWFGTGGASAHLPPQAYLSTLQQLPMEEASLSPGAISIVKAK